MKWTDPCRAPSIGRLRAAPLGDLDQKVIRAYVQGILSRILRRTGQGNSLSFAVQPMGKSMGGTAGLIPCPCVFRRHADTSPDHDDLRVASV